MGPRFYRDFLGREIRVGDICIFSTVAATHNQLVVVAPDIEGRLKIVGYTAYVKLVAWYFNPPGSGVFEQITVIKAEDLLFRLGDEQVHKILELQQKILAEIDSE